MATLAKGHTFTGGDEVTATKLNDLVDAATISNIVNDDISASAAIAHNKLANITAGQVLLGNASNVPTATALTGDVTVTSGGVTAIASGVILDADINAAAEIAVSKLADGAARQLVQTDAAGTGVEWTSNVDVPGTLDVTGAAVLDSTLTVAGATTLNGNVTIGDADNIILATGTGTKIGTATTQKLGFYNATPIVQPAGADQAAVPTTGATDSSPFGYTEAQANAIVALVNEMRSVLVNLGLMKGAA